MLDEISRYRAESSVLHRGIEISMQPHQDTNEENWPLRDDSVMSSMSSLPALDPLLSGRGNVLFTISSMDGSTHHVSIYSSHKGG